MAAASAGLAAPRWLVADLEKELRPMSASDPGEVRSATLERSGQVSALRKR